VRVWARQSTRQATSVLVPTLTPASSPR